MLTQKVLLQLPDGKIHLLHPGRYGLEWVLRVTPRAVPPMAEVVCR